MAVAILPILLAGGAGLAQPQTRPDQPPQARAAHENRAATSVRVGGIVLKWVLDEKQLNYGRAEPLIREAAARGARIVITTECFLDGYAIRNKEIPEPQWRTLCEPIPDGQYVTRLRQLADELDIHLVAGMVECTPDATYNTAVLIGPDGALLGKYRKHDLGHELWRNTPGDQTPAFDTPYGRVGLMICADRRNRELVRRIADGVDLLICPSGGMWGPERNDFYLQNRSRENRVPIVFVHPIEFLVTAADGAILDRRFAGDTMTLQRDEVGGEKDVQLVAVYDVPLRTERSRNGHAQHPARAQACPAEPLVGNWPGGRAAMQPLSLRCVRLDGFLGRHVDASNDSLLAGLESPLPGAFEARAAGREPPEETIRLASDSDFYKWLEGACYALAYEPDARSGLRAAVDRYADIIIGLQRPDGYIGTGISPVRPFDEKVRHDLYVAGHLIEAAVAHHAATGQRKLLDAAVRLADFYLDAFRKEHPYYRLIGQEHPEIEVALVRLARATGEPRFIDFSADLTRRAELAPDLRDVRAGAGRRHAVRLCYQLTGAAELWLQTGRDEFHHYLRPLWDQIVNERMYLTGGIGYNEVVPERPYDLPQTLTHNPHRDIAETCASISMMMWSWRMHGIGGEARTFDVIERILYNHCLGALSPDHRGNFYYNPLRRVGDLTGQTDHRGNPVRRTMLPAIHSTTCCLPNAWRFFGQLPEYVFSSAPGRLAVNLYTAARAQHRLGDADVQVEMTTRYPDDGEVTIRLHPARAARFTLSLRIPGWCERAGVRVNDAAGESVQGGQYHDITRTWQPGDRVVLSMPMPPAVVFPRPEVEANRGQVALRRGPVVYCLEKQDAAGLDLERAIVLIDRANPSGSVREEADADLGFHILRVRAGERAAPSGDDSPAREGAASDEAGPSASPAEIRGVREVTLIPFYYRANRDADTRWLTWIPYRYE